MNRARRDGTFFLDDLYQTFLHAPIWAGPVFAIFTYAVFRWVVPWSLHGLMDDNPVGHISVQVFGPASVTAAPWLTGGVCLLWLLAIGRRLIDRPPQTLQTGIDRVRDLHSGTRSQPTGATIEESTSGLACPVCSAPMVKRTAKRGPGAGSEFWGCSRFPTCRGTRNVD
jgi:hypothetical protein